MPSRVPPSNDEIRELEILIHAHHPLVLIESLEEARVHALLRYVADRLSLPLLSWTPTQGLIRELPTPGRPPDAKTLESCLAFIESAQLEAIFHLRGIRTQLDNDKVNAQMEAIYQGYFRHRGAVVVSGGDVELGASLELMFTRMRLGAPTPESYRQFVTAVLRDMAKTRNVEVGLTGEDVGRLLAALHGLTFVEVQKIITQAVVESGGLSAEDIDRVIEAKRRTIERSGVLEYFPHEYELGDIAGLRNLKAWLDKRRVAFEKPEEAKAFGLTPPRGLLLIGVQGCGKSLCAKAVAMQWKLPLIRLDPSNLYQKYFGESEKNLRRAIETAESLAPVVLWIDEIEKALSQDQNDGGTSSRLFGTFLSWMQEKKESVFVIATANEISKLPPELLRKGRFDEIFFVDLPDSAARKEILAIHLRRRERTPGDFDLEKLSQVTEGFSGAEIEQGVVSALYTAFSRGEALNDALLLEEYAQTRPLSTTMSERIESLRQWAKDRAVPANG